MPCLVLGRCPESILGEFGGGDSGVLGTLLILW